MLAWAIKYRDAVWDHDEGRRVSEVAYTAFTSRPRNLRVTARLIVRRGKRLNPKTVPEDQGGLFAAHRHPALVRPVGRHSRCLRSAAVVLGVCQRAREVAGRGPDRVALGG